jgi:hypothetical protein
MVTAPLPLPTPRALKRKKYKGKVRIPPSCEDKAGKPFKEKNGHST